jgi:hypothetical protein
MTAGGLRCSGGVNRSFLREEHLPVHAEIEHYASKIVGLSD